MRALYHHPRDAGRSPRASNRISQGKGRSTGGRSQTVEEAAYRGRFWSVAALACAAAVGCVPVFSAREEVSAISQYAALVVVGLAVVSVMLRVPKIHPGMLCYAGLVGMWAFTFGVSEAPGYYTFVKLVVFGLALHVLIRTPKQLMVVLGGYSLAAVVSVAINWSEIRELRYAMETVERSASNMRLDGTFMNANRAGIFASMALVSALVVFFNMRHPVRWFILVSGGSSALLIGGLSGSRTGMIGILLAGLAVPLMATAGERGQVFARASKASLLTGVAIVIAATTLLQLPQFERLMRLQDGTAADGSTSARWAMAKASVDVWLKYPILGAGFRGYEKVSEFAGRPAHTAFGAVLADGGIVGFALFCTWYFLPGWHLLALARRHPDASVRRLAVGLLVFLGVFVVGSMFSHLHGSRDLIPLWAGICGFIQQQRTGRRLTPARV